MLIGCITGPDFETAKSQVLMANRWCEGIELRLDLLNCLTEELESLAKGIILFTNKGQIQCKDMTISTYHNFEETPHDLEKVLDQMPQADIYKICTLANKTTDALRMLSFVQDRGNVAGMCMGEMGQITRILAPVVGSKLTFASLGKKAAPGQIDAEELIETYHFKKLNRHTQIYGLIGNPVSQSPSHKTHNAFFRKEEINAVYVKMLLEEEELKTFLPLVKKIGFKGLSVTMPFKETILSYIDEIEEEEIKAVNTLTIDDKIKGANTDGIGGLNALGPVDGKKIVILGAGGSAKAIAHEAKKRGATVFLHSRRFANLDQIPEYDILVNTTPNPVPIDLKFVRPHTTVMDITLSHAGSPLIERAKALECAIVKAETMFYCQAQEQFIRWAHIPSSPGYSARLHCGQ